MWLKKICFVIICAIFIVVGSSDIYSFDGDGYRKGLIVGLGGGPHVTGGGFGSAFPENGTAGLASSLKVGAGITDQFLLYFFGDIIDSQRTVGLIGIGARYYLRPESKSVYFDIGLGTGTATGTGTAFFGIGYELQKHLSIEYKTSLTYINVEFANGDGDTDGGITGMLTLNYLFY